MTLNEYKDHDNGYKCLNDNGYIDYNDINMCVCVCGGGGGYVISVML